MNFAKSWKPLTITGAVLLLNGIVFSILTTSIQFNTMWGMAIGCIVAGIPLLITGLVQKNKLNGKPIKMANQ